MDRRWQMVLDCMGAEEPVMSQGTVFAFRERARAHGFMERLLQKTVRLARESGGFSSKRLRALIDSSPLVGAGRVEDTFNLLGRAISKLAATAASEAGSTSAELASELELSVVTGSSVKAALDLDWRLPSARDDALRELISQFERLCAWLRTQFSEEQLSTPPLSAALEVVGQILEQDTTPDPDPPPPGRSAPATRTQSSKDTGGSALPAQDAGTSTSSRKLRDGTAADRLISLSDPDMRHGCKSRTKKFNGYKRHIVGDADIPGLIHDVEVLPGNQREHDAAEPLLGRLQARGFEITELHIDRGYLAADAVHEMRDGSATVITKPPTPARTERYGKYDFQLDTKAKLLTCPAGKSIPYRGDRTSHRFRSADCRSCSRRDRCVTPKNKYGRVVGTHAHESFFREMHAELSTPEGRERRRARIPVEHALARVGQIQSRHARFRGSRKTSSTSFVLPSLRTSTSSIAPSRRQLEQCWSAL
ncbi:MAG: transposase [Sandaracinaceae bacterium]